MTEREPGPVTFRQGTAADDREVWEQLIDSYYRRLYGRYESALRRGAIDRSVVFHEWLMTNQQAFLDGPATERALLVFDGSIWELLELINQRLAATHTQLRLEAFAGYDKKYRRVIILSLSV